MRLRVIHETSFLYATPASRAIETLRLTPRSHDTQFVVDWRIEIDHDCRLDADVDAFGNTVHSFTVEGPLEGLAIVATGEIETEDSGGVLRGTLERFPDVVFLRETDLTRPDDGLKALAAEAQEAGGDSLATLHALNTIIRERLTFDVEGTDTTTTASEAYALRHGVCQDFAHIFIAAARHMGVPARYVGGYLYRAERRMQEAGHGWAEAMVPDIGWIGFDPANGISPTDAYIRSAIGLDYLGAAPVRGTRFGGSGEKMTVRVAIEQVAPQARRPPAMAQTQSQGGQTQSQASVAPPPAADPAGSAPGSASMKEPLHRVREYRGKEGGPPANLAVMAGLRPGHPRLSPRRRCSRGCPHARA